MKAKKGSNENLVHVENALGVEGKVFVSSEYQSLDLLNTKDWTN